MIIGSSNRLSAEIARQSRLAQDVARLQVEISGEKRILAPSDDPGGAARVTQIRTAQASEKAWAANADGAAALASLTETNLTALGTAIDRAVELMTLARSASASAADRKTYATEIAGIVLDITELAGQTDSRGQPLFPEAPLAIPVGKTSTLQATLGRETVFGPAGSDMVSVLNAAVAALNSDATDVIAATDDDLTAMQAARNRLTDARGEHGARAAVIDQVRARFVSSGLALREERSNIEDTDITAAAPRLQAKILTLEAAQASFARIHKQTLFDLLG